MTMVLTDFSTLKSPFFALDGCSQWFQDFVLVYDSEGRSFLIGFILKTVQGGKISDFSLEFGRVAECGFSGRSVLVRCHMGW